MSKVKKSKRIYFSHLRVKGRSQPEHLFMSYRHHVVS